MTKRAIAPVVVLLALGSLAQAQGDPFDMSTERQQLKDVPPALPAPSSRSDAPPAPPASPPPQAPRQPAAEDVEREAVASEGTERPYSRTLLPAPELILEGENPERNWAFYLTEAQAASASALQYAYQSAVVIAPEASRLRIRINGVSVADEPVLSPDGIGTYTAAIPTGILYAGRNELNFSAEQRHRTDCSVESTYELWTEVDAARTFLSFGDADASKYRTKEDLRALSADASGRTVVHIVAPAISVDDIGSDLVELAQVIGLHAPLPGLQFTVGPTLPEGGGALTVLVGKFDEIGDLVSGSVEGMVGPVARFASTTRDGAPVFIVAGATREEWRAAIDDLRGAVDQPPLTRRDTLKSERSRAPDAPMLYGAQQIAFSDLGLRSQNFSGRRFHTEFQIAVPSDFYAEAYGEAGILLDAAYSSEVLPGSLVNIYVNGNIAASVPITDTGGAIMNKQPIKVTMRHFQHGLNLVAIDAVLRTASDAECAPGSASGGKPRFALFDTSVFVMPKFGRIGHWPDLTAISGTGYPYSLDTAPVAVVAGRGDLKAVSAAASMFSRMAIAASRVIDTEFVASTARAGGRNAVIFGPINGIPEATLQQLGISPASRTIWSGYPSSTSAQTVTPDEWRQTIEGSWINQTLRGIQTWMSDTFAITDDMLRFAPGMDEVFLPPQSATLVIAQRSDPGTTGLWTLVTAPSADLLQESVAAVVSQTNWQRLSGHLTTFDIRTGELSSRPVKAFEFVETQPRSFTNLRLVVANWLSANILSYALLLVLVCLGLGAATSVMLDRLGRRQ